MYREKEKEAAREREREREGESSRETTVRAVLRGWLPLTAIAPALQVQIISITNMCVYYPDYFQHGCRICTGLRTNFAPSAGQIPWVLSRPRTICAKRFGGPWFFPAQKILSRTKVDSFPRKSWHVRTCRTWRSWRHTRSGSSGAARPSRPPAPAIRWPLLS